MKNKKSADVPLRQRLSIQPPAMPSVVRYIDDFTEQHHSLSNLEDRIWKVTADGTVESINFSAFEHDANLLGVIKALVADRLVRNQPGTANGTIGGLNNIPPELLIQYLETDPSNVRTLWDILRAERLPRAAYDSVKALLRFAGERRLGRWTPSYLPFISSSLPLPPRDKYAVARSRVPFLAIEEEAKLVRWIDYKSQEAIDLSDDELADAALVVCAYQFAMRPKQIGMLRRRDCRIVFSPTEKSATAHLTFRMIKQRTDSMGRMTLVRRVKREWVPIMSEISERGNRQPGDSHLFGHQSAASVATRLKDVLFDILSTPRLASHLRHSGAMRMVDAGASAEELAEFMGHSSLESGLVYYDVSPTQAERVNQALGISETYQRLARLGNERFISHEELLRLKGDQQIAGVPHGVPIAGIGACETGQPSCPFNPITACYGCPRFMPVNEAGIHKQVLADFRGVVKYFHDVSRGETESPAYLQLRRTIAEVTAVIDELENPNA
jgi:integrase